MSGAQEEMDERWSLIFIKENGTRSHQTSSSDACMKELPRAREDFTHKVGVCAERLRIGLRQTEGRTVIVQSQSSIVIGW